MVFYLQVLEEFVTGQRQGRVGWEESWSVKTVDGPAWVALRAGVSAAEARFPADCRTSDGADPEHFGGALSMLTHTAFHVGALRQHIDGAKHPET